MAMRVNRSAVPMRGQCEGRSRSALRRLILEGRVRIDGRAVSKPSLPLKPGMRVVVELPPPPPPGPTPEAIPLDLLHEDEHLLVVLKPAGMVVHPGHGRSSGTLVNALMGRGVPLSPVGAMFRLIDCCSCHGGFGVFSCGIR